MSRDAGQTRDGSVPMLSMRNSLPELSLAYNGGKDCLVLLILYLCALHTKAASSSKGASTEPIQCVYIQAEHPFEEVEEFVVSSSKTYSLSLLEYAKPMKAAFADYLQDMPSVKAIFVGTRRTDPHGEHLKHFDPTDHGWPEFVRIHPVIDWHYVDIWTVSYVRSTRSALTDYVKFIRHLNIPYCILYDRGYTSLGGTDDTHPNPALASSQSPKSAAVDIPTNGSGTTKFRPAYELIDDYEERLGRDR
jgi:FAD synthetase